MSYTHTLRSFWLHFACNLGHDQLSWHNYPGGLQYFCRTILCKACDYAHRFLQWSMPHTSCNWNSVVQQLVWWSTSLGVTHCEIVNGWGFKSWSLWAADCRQGTWTFVPQYSLMGRSARLGLIELHAHGTDEMYSHAYKILIHFESC